MHNTYGNAAFASPTRSAASVRIYFGVVRQLIINHMREVMHVQSACCHIGSNEQLHSSQAEALHHVVSRHLRQIAMKRIGIVTILNQFF